MTKPLLLLLFLCFFLLSSSQTSTPAYTQKVESFINSWCSGMLSSCQSDSICNATLACDQQCPWNDTSCLEQCAFPARVNANFWSLQLCSINAAEAQADGEEGAENLSSCVIGCSSVCSEDSTCTSVMSCLSDCNEETIAENDDVENSTKDNYCHGACVAAEGGAPGVMEWMHCQSVCAFSWLAQ